MKQIIKFFSGDEITAIINIFWTVGIIIAIFQIIKTFIMHKSKTKILKSHVKNLSELLRPLNYPESYQGYKAWYKDILRGKRDSTMDKLIEEAKTNICYVEMTYNSFLSELISKLKSLF